MTKSRCISFQNKRRRIYRYWTYDIVSHTACWHASHRAPKRSEIKHGNFIVKKIIYSPNNLRYDKITCSLKHRDSGRIVETITNEQNCNMMICQTFIDKNGKIVEIPQKSCLKKYFVGMGMSYKSYDLNAHF